ncbi:MAG: glycosyltransferase [Rhodospirillales bacterium]
MSKKVLVSVALSFRNEDDVLSELISRLDAVLSKPLVDYDLVFVNDDSTDGSYVLLKKAAAKNKKTKIVSMAVAGCL